MTTLNQNRTYMEVIDPVTGAQVDVTVCLHARIVVGVSADELARTHQGAVGRVLVALEAAGFDLSDTEEGKRPYKGARMSETTTIVWVLTCEEDRELGVEVFATREAGEARLAAAVAESGCTIDPDMDDHESSDENSHVVYFLDGPNFELGKCEVQPTAAANWPPVERKRGGTP